MLVEVDKDGATEGKTKLHCTLGVVAGAAARQTEERKHTCNDTICSELGWKCVPLVVETFGASLVALHTLALISFQNKKFLS